MFGIWFIVLMLNWFGISYLDLKGYFKSIFLVGVELWEIILVILYWVVIVRGMMVVGFWFFLFNFNSKFMV